MHLLARQQIAVTILMILEKVLASWEAWKWLFINKYLKHILCTVEWGWDLGIRKEGNWESDARWEKKEKFYI